MNATSRRAVFAGAIGAAATMAAPAHAEDGVPGLVFALAATVKIGPSQTPGPTPFGTRNRIPILGGTFEGPNIKGTVLPGGADWQLIRPDGAVTLDADYMIQAEDGALIHVHNRAVLMGTPGKPDFYLRCTPVFEAPIGKHDWLNKAVFAGAVDVLGPEAVRVRVYKIV